MKIIKLGVLILTLFLTSLCYGQSEIYTFQLIEKPLETIYLDSVLVEGDSLTTISIALGDSISVEGFCFVADTLDIQTLYFEVGNESSVSSYNIFNDSVDYMLLPYQSQDFEIDRSSQFIHVNFGTTIKTDTLYGTCTIKGLHGIESNIKSYPIHFEF